MSRLSLVRHDEQPATITPSGPAEQVIGAPEPLPDAMDDLNLPKSDEVLVIGERLGLSPETVAEMSRLARLRESYYRGISQEVEYAATDLQVERAFWGMYEGKEHFARLPWAAADAITGPLAPGMLVMLAARTGQGKTTFLLNATDRWTEAGVGVVYLGLEQTPRELRTKWAAIRAGIPPEVPLAHDVSRLPAGLTLNDALSRVASEMAWQSQGQRRHTTRFAPVKFVGRRQLVEVAAWAHDVGAQLLIVDHVDRLDHGDGFNSFAEMSATIRLAKELAVKYDLVMLLASQAKRATDKVEAFLPMELSDMRGGGTKEEESDIVLTTYRPLHAGVTAKDLTEVRQGLVDRNTVLVPSVMGIRNIKARLNDSHLGKSCQLRVWYGRISEMTPPLGPPHVRSQHGRAD